MDVHELGQRVADLERRLCAAEDHLAIQNLKAHYAALTDRRYTRAGIRPPAELEPLAREIASLFTEDAVWDGGKGLGLCEGRPAIYERFLAPTLKFSWHYFVKPQIEIEADTARATWDILAPCTTRDGKAHWMAGVEEDEYRRVGGQWLHSRMKLRVVFMASHERGWA